MISALRARLARLEQAPAAPAYDAGSFLGRLRARDERALRRAVDDLPGGIRPTPDGDVWVSRTVFPPSHRHGVAPIASALEASSADLARIALDESLAAFRVEDAVFLDTETSGLAGGTGTIPFLIGAGWFEEGSFVVEQLFVREPADEPAALRLLARRLSAAGAIVSFNGKTFDVPLLRTRFILARLPPPDRGMHLDLLHASRRVFRRRIRECRLGSLESHALGFVREGDVPGSMIPGIYQDWLVSGASAMLEAVFLHNVQDVVALPALLGHVGRVVARPHDEPEPDRIGIAQTALRAGSADLAERILDGVHAREGRLLYANVLRRRGARHEAASVWRDLIAADPGDAEAHLQLAKHVEHVERDADRALRHATAARTAETPGASDRRLSRLERKRLVSSELPARERERR